MGLKNEMARKLENVMDYGSSSKKGKKKLKVFLFLHTVVLLFLYYTTVITVKYWQYGSYHK